MAEKNFKPLAELTANDIDRHWEQVPKGGPDECWLWKGYRSSTGYGMLRVGKRQRVLAHRTAFWLANGYDPTPLFVCHSCDQPACVNPRHLWCGTQKDNMSDCSAKGRAHFGDQHGMRKHPEAVSRGERSGNAKLTEGDVIAMRVLYDSGSFRPYQIAPMFGITSGHCRCIVYRKKWAHLP